MSFFIFFSIFIVYEFYWYIIKMNKDKDRFIKENICKINEGNFKESDCFKEMEEIFHSFTNLKTYLKEYYLNKIESDVDLSLTNKLLKEFKKHGCVKNKIKYIANENFFYKRDLEEFYQKTFFLKIKNNLEKDNNKIINNLVLLIIENIKDNLKELKQENNMLISDMEAYKHIESDFKKLAIKMMELLSIGGFAKNIQNINSGIMTANAGDSAQFLFLSRAILAGYNCSNVDVRSSRYDAVIDYKNILLRVQVKGISSNEISFVDRDRGGQGIDFTHERNKGKRITSEDCDLYVAVDKDNGICFIIPMDDIDTKYKMVSKAKVLELKEYKENWLLIQKIAENKNSVKEK